MTPQSNVIDYIHSSMALGLFTQFRSACLLSFTVFSSRQTPREEKSGEEKKTGTPLARFFKVSTHTRGGAEVPGWLRNNRRVHCWSNQAGVFFFFFLVLLDIFKTVSSDVLSTVISPGKCVIISSSVFDFTKRAKVLRIARITG